MDSQYVDEWVNTVQHWMVIKGIDLNSIEAIEIIGFKLKGSGLTADNNLRRHKCMTATFFTFMLVLHNFNNPSTSMDLLKHRWKICNPCN